MSEHRIASPSLRGGRRPARRWGAPWRGALSLALGAVLGVVLLHPATMAIYWLEFHAQLSDDWASGGQFVLARLLASFSPPMLPMSGLFALLGLSFGGVFAVFDRRLRRSEAALSRLTAEVGRELPALIARGESEHLEFKSGARWDYRRDRFNKDLADVIARAIASLANHEGGSLLIGVADDGGIVGLERDYGTLKTRGRDGFAQFLMTLVRERMGARVCRLVHPLFVRLDGHDVCRVIIEPAPHPVFVDQQGQARFFVRTGNATRELDAREAVDFVTVRWPGRGSR